MVGMTEDDALRLVVLIILVSIGLVIVYAAYWAFMTWFCAGAGGSLAACP